MKFYAYEGRKVLGKEPLGSSGKMMFELKTVQGALRKAYKAYGSLNFSLYYYTNFYEDSTFTQVH